MLKLVLLLAIVATAAAQADYRSIQLVKSTNDNDGTGAYSYSYENSDGSKAQESGSLKPGQGKEEPALQVQGSSFYTAPDGTKISLEYDANEFGFQPRGAHLPTPPPTPDYILRALEYIRKNPGPDAAPRASRKAGRF